MAKARLTIATSFALALLWAGAAGAAPAAAQSTGQSSAISRGGASAAKIAASGSARVSGLTARQRKARARALKKCRRKARKARRKSCVKRVRKHYRAKARVKRNPGKSKDGPAVIPATKVYDVAVLDDYFDPNRIEIKSGEAIRFVWGEHNKDAHNITLLSGPPGVSPLDFELGSAPSLGMVFQRTFTVPGSYTIACSLHHLQLIDVTVTA